MDAEDALGTGIYSQVDADALSNIGAIPTRKTLMLVNNFISNTVDFMNKFAVLCERKLSKIST